MHHTSVVEYDQVALRPTVGVYILCGVYPLLEAIHNLSHLFDVVNDLDFSTFGVFGRQLEDAAAVDLREWTIGVEWISPNDLPSSVYAMPFIGLVQDSRDALLLCPTNTQTTHRAGFLCLWWGL